MPNAAPNHSIAAMRAVRLAAAKLDAACTAIVGQPEMAIGKAFIRALAEPVPEDMLETAAKLQAKLDGLH